MRRVIFLLPLFLLGGLAAVFALDVGRDPRAIPSALIGRPVPEFALPPLESGGKGLAAADLRGGVTVVNVFASWCPPCRVEHPVLKRLAQSATVVGIAYKDRPADTLAWLHRLGNPYAAVGADAEGRVALDWGVTGVPETFVVDASGRIRFKHAGPLTPDIAESQLLPHIVQAGRS